MRIAIKRVYDKAAADDGTRVLIDRLWPRGLRKSKAHIDVWAKDIAPSTELRMWYNHEPFKRSAFIRKYRRELKANVGAIEQLLSSIDRRKRLTLLTATRELDASAAPVVRDFLNRQKRHRSAEHNHAQSRSS